MIQLNQPQRLDGYMSCHGDGWRQEEPTIWAGNCFLLAPAATAPSPGTSELQQTHYAKRGVNSMFQQLYLSQDHYSQSREDSYL